MKTLIPILMVGGFWLFLLFQVPLVAEASIVFGTILFIVGLFESRPVGNFMAITGAIMVIGSSLFLKSKFAQKR